MSSNTALDAINPHIYGLRAVAARSDQINKIIPQSITNENLIQSISYIKHHLAAGGDQDRAMASLIQYSTTGDRDAAVQQIKSYEYLAANLHLGKHMHALVVRDQQVEHRSELPQPVLEQMPPYPEIDNNYQPVPTAIIEILFETIQASNAPSAGDFTAAA